MRGMFLVISTATLLSGCVTTRYVNDPTCSAEFRTSGAHAIAFSSSTQRCYVADQGQAAGANEALGKCREAGNRDCDLYAVNGEVVAQKQEHSFGMRELTPDERAAMLIMAYGIQNATKPRPIPQMQTNPVQSQTIQSPGQDQQMAISECSSDFDCGSGRVCVKAAQQIGFTGRCVTPVNQSGIQTYVPPQGTLRTEGGCQFDTQCNMAMGFRCVKNEGQLYGLCIKN